jgi:hypothetical protein
VSQNNFFFWSPTIILLCSQFNFKFTWKLKFIRARKYKKKIGMFPLIKCPSHNHEPGVSQKKRKLQRFRPLIFAMKKRSERKNELYHEQELFMPFSKHFWLLFLGFVNHYWQLKQAEVIFIKIFLITKQHFW